MPRDINGRDSALIEPDRSHGARPGSLYEAPDNNNISPRVGVAWDVTGDGLHVAARRLRHVLQHQQLAEPDRHGDQSAGDAARRVPESDVPESAVRSHVRAVDSPDSVGRRDAARAGVEPQPAARALGQHRGRRSATPDRAASTCCAATTSTRRARRPAPTAGRSSRAGAPRQNTAWTTIELKSSDGDSWYRALIVEARRRWSQRLHVPVVVHVVEVRRHDAGVDVLLGRDQRHDVGVSRIHSRLQQGPVGLPRRAQLGDELQLRPAVRARSSPASTGALLERLARVGHRQRAQRQPADRVRAEQPLALAVAAVARPRHRARSCQLRAGLWSRQRGHRRSRRRGSIPRRSCCSRRARSATPAAATSSGRTCAPSICRSSRTRRGRGSAPADASKCGSRCSTSSTAPTSARRADRVCRRGRQRAAAGELRPRAQHDHLRASDSARSSRPVLGFPGFLGSWVPTVPAKSTGAGVLRTLGSTESPPPYR